MPSHYHEIEETRYIFHCHVVYLNGGLRFNPAFDPKHLSVRNIVSLPPVASRNGTARCQSYRDRKS